MLLQKLCCVVSTMICVRRRRVVKYFQGGEIVQLWWQWNVVTEGVTPSPLLEIIGQSLPEMLLDNLFFTWLHNKNSQILDFLENLFEPAQICPWEWLRIFRNFTWNDDVKSFFCIVGMSWMGWGRVEWYWHMAMSYLTSLNTQLFKNIAYVGSFGHYPVQITFICILLSSFFRS